MFFNWEPTNRTEYRRYVVVFPCVCYDPNGKVLYRLQFVNVGRGCIRPHGGAIIKFTHDQSCDDCPKRVAIEVVPYSVYLT